MDIVLFGLRLYNSSMLFGTVFPTVSLVFV
uniref:Uncharacterized protein n=1 Tax=Arundo donax TaxID=35708 RepID=A0A0A9AA45_ARUDO